MIIMCFFVFLITSYISAKKDIIFDVFSYYIMWLGYDHISYDNLSYYIIFDDKH